MGADKPRRLEERLVREVMLALALFGVVLVQTTVLPRPLDVAPNIMLMLVVCRALVSGLPNAARWAFYGGLSLDVCAGSTLGTHALALLAAVICAGLPLMRLHRENWLLPLVGALLGTLAYHAVLALLTTLLVAPVPIETYAVIVAVPNLVITLIPVLPLFLAMRWYVSRQRGEVPIDLY
jgi:rod shape-determining protein MreD